MTSNASATDVAELARLFGKRETITGVRISPQGDYLLYRTPAGPRETRVVTLEIASGKSTSLLSSLGTDLSINDCLWVKVDRIGCAISGEQADGKLRLGFSRTIFFGRNESESKKDTKSRARMLDRAALAGSIINTLPDSSESVLVDLPDFEGLTVQEFNIYTGRRRETERSHFTAIYHMSDSKGRVRLRATNDEDSNGRLKNTRRYFVRMKDSNDWQPLAIKNLQEFDSFRPAGFDETDVWLYALKPYNERQAMFRIALDGTLREELVFAHPAVDVDGLVTFGRYAKPVGVSYSTDYNHIEYFDPAIKSLTASLGKALSGKEVTLLGDSWDGSRVLLVASSDDDPGTYYLFDRTTKKLQAISPVRPDLADKSMALTNPVSFTAADGAAVPAYLTLPPGGNGKGLPLVVMPHGGPEARDYWGFDWLVQFLAANGYAVLQPNFRGSAGYGKAWLNENAIKNWRRAIDDVNDSARWAIAQGIADPRRIAILGWSYGGYAALQSNVVAPDLYKAAVAIAPVSDWQQMKADAQRYTNVKIVKDYIGSGPHVREGSPAQNAAAIRAPVMLFHGTMDLNVNVRQSLAMKSALERASKSVTYTEYEGLNHGLADSDARTDMLTKIGNFLAANLR
jgi:dipeptidyl aminopeptidase/acylaminoacyl peptidase